VVLRAVGLPSEGLVEEIPKTGISVRVPMRVPVESLREAGVVLPLGVDVALAHLQRRDANVIIFSHAQGSVRAHARDNASVGRIVGAEGVIAGDMADLLITSASTLER
jgi:hypothetical protein